MITDEELHQQIADVSESYKGQLDDLYKAVGMLVVGRLFGWRVMRLVASRSVWSKASKLFGDPKQLMEPEGRLAYKSCGLNAIKTVSEYWDVINGVEKIPKEEKAAVL
jgi:hypothetical protein